MTGADQELKSMREVRNTAALPKIEFGETGKKREIQLPRCLVVGNKEVDKIVTMGKEAPLAIVRAAKEATVVATTEKAMGIKAIILGVEEGLLVLGLVVDRRFQI